MGPSCAGGDVLRTSVAGRAFVHLPDGSHLRVGAASQLALTRSEADDVALTLERGTLAVRASHQSSARASWCTPGGCRCTWWAPCSG